MVARGLGATVLSRSALHPERASDGLRAAELALQGLDAADDMGRGAQVLERPGRAEVADQVDAGMVVMGSQGRTGLKHLMLGSKAEQIVRLCPVPVLIVKNGTHDHIVT